MFLKPTRGNRGIGILIARRLDEGYELMRHEHGPPIVETCSTMPALVEAVLGWRPPAQWQLRLRGRRDVARRAAHAPLDDLYLTAPGVAQPFRSCKQAARSAARADFRAPRQ